MAIEWDVSREDAQLILRIAKRAEPHYEAMGIEYKRQTIAMDVTAVHRNGCPLHLHDLLGFDDVDFFHDIGGIRRHLDRKTGQLGGSFLPRCAA